MWLKKLQKQRWEELKKTIHQLSNQELISMRIIYEERLNNLIKEQDLESMSRRVKRLERKKLLYEVSAYLIKVLVLFSFLIAVVSVNISELKPIDILFLSGIPLFFSALDQFFADKEFIEELNEKSQLFFEIKTLKKVIQLIDEELKRREEKDA